MGHERRPTYDFGDFRLDLSEHQLLRDCRPVPLTPKVFDLLRVLVENGGHLVEKQRLLSEVWPDSFVEEGALNRSVSVLRKTLGESPSDQKYIETVPKRGYRFVAPITIDSESRPSTVPTGFRWAAIAKDAAGLTAALLALGAISYLVLRPFRPEAKAPPTMTLAHRQVTHTGKEGSPALSPDGSRIAYVSAGTPEKKLLVQDLSGGQPVAILSAPEVNHVRWSPDGVDLIVWARGSGLDGVYLIPQSGGTPRLLAGRQYMACWSPDGSTIVVADYLARKMWFLDRFGKEQRSFIPHGTHESIWDIDWSPANHLLAYVSSDYRGNYSVWTVRPDGTDQRQVASASTEIASARWSRHGDAIYYFRRLNQTFSLDKILVSPDDADRAAVATTLITGLETDGKLGLSANGSRLAYARAPYHSNLWRLEIGGAGVGRQHELKELTQGTSLIERPSFSPDDGSIVFNVGHQGQSNVFVMRAAGGAWKQLTFLDSFNLGGVWSADGRRIAFASTQGGKPRVWTVAAAGGSLQALSSGVLSDSFDLAWSPEPRIVYQQAGNRNYFELDPETRRERLLLPPGSVGWVFSPVYSRDGQKIAVFWNRPPHSGVWVIDAVDRHETLVYRRASASASAVPLGWSVDGTSIYVLEGKPLAPRGLTAPLGLTMTGARIISVPVNGGDVKAMAALPFDEIGGADISADGRQIVFTVYASRSDVWIVDDFDAPLERRMASRSSDARHSPVLHLK